MEATQEERNKLQTIALWVVFIPGSILGGALAWIAIFAFLGAGSWLMGMKFDAPLNLLLAGGWSGYASVYVGSVIAPSQSKRIPALIIGSIMMVVGLIAMFIRVNNGEWFRALEGLAVLLGAGLAVVNSKDKKF